MKRSRKIAGISLVALVVTIIVLIILTGAVIATFMEGGIIDRAKESVFKNDIRSYQEMLVVKNGVNEIDLQTGNGTVTRLNATELVDIQGILPEFKDEYNELVAISEGELVLGARVTQAEKDMTDDEIKYKKWLTELGIGLGTVADVEYTIGQEVSITDSEGIEHNFYVMEDSGSILTLLAKGAINTTTYTQADANSIQFSETNYWYKDEEFITYDLNDYGVVEAEGQEGKAYALEAAMAYGTNLGGTGRLMTKAEAESWQDDGELQTKLYEVDDYWLGSADERYGESMWFVFGYGEFLDIISYDGATGLRPVITISESAIN